MKIHKYALKILGLSATTPQTIEMHEDAVVLSFHNQDGVPVVYVAEDTRRIKVERRFWMVMTGHESPPLSADADVFVGTALFDNGRFVLHLFTEARE